MGAVEDALRSRPVVGNAGGSTGPTPIGVPEYVRGPDGKPRPFLGGGSYTSAEGIAATLAATPGPGEMAVFDDYGHPPRYWDGDEYAPANWPDEKIAALQAQMAASGLYGDGSYVRGLWAKADIAAYRTVLSYANQTGTDSEFALGRISELFSESPEKPKPPALVTNPEDIKETIRQASRKVLGSSDVPEDQLQRLVAAYQGEQIRQVQQQQTPTGQSAITAAPSMETFAENRVRELDPLKADARMSLKGFDVVRKMFGGEG